MDKTIFKGLVCNNNPTIFAIWSAALAIILFRSSATLLSVFTLSNMLISRAGRCCAVAILRDVICFRSSRIAFNLSPQ